MADAPRSHNQRWRDVHMASLLLDFELEDPRLSDVERFVYLAASRLLDLQRVRSLQLDDDGYTPGQLQLSSDPLADVAPLELGGS